MARRSRVWEAPARAALVRQWEASDEGQAAFARRHGVHPRTFWGWCRPGARAAPAFVPVTIVEAARAAVIVTIVWPSGERVEVHGADSGVLLAQAVAALRQTC
jgi:transposase-like protein